MADSDAHLRVVTTDDGLVLVGSDEALGRFDAASPAVRGLDARKAAKAGTLFQGTVGDQEQAGRYVKRDGESYARGRELHRARK